ncbi:MAG: aminomethyl-transferring glycine dehydrogenase subunit GcvPA, partial [Spirochaetales bacterium]|nr:aminomethyl-transferring glycine dehydrogenase subunit GcvPA [Spirochaetales bacterium]
MLDALGIQKIDDLFTDVPEANRFPDLNLPPAMSEMEVLREIDELAGRNTTGPGIPGRRPLSFAGAGAYQHFIPSVVSYLAGRGEFTTAYTPYQAEASQGTLQAMFEYQSMLCDLLDMDAVNASHYDGATAVAEAAIMAVRATRGRDKVVFSGALHPEYIEVAKSYLQPQGITVEIADSPDLPGAADQSTAALIVQNPDFLGRIHDLSGLADQVHNRGALLVLHVDPIATALFKSPGSLGADIVTGEGQPLGIPVSFGGPYLGIFATRASLVRKMPGRLVGRTTDTDGRRGFVLTLNTREQHIRREKATSNICTNQGLMALRAAIYLASMGPIGLREVAERCYHNAHYAADRLAEISGCSVNAGDTTPYFKEFVLTTPLPADTLISQVVSQ